MNALGRAASRGLACRPAAHGGVVRWRRAAAVQRRGAATGETKNAAASEVLQKILQTGAKDAGRRKLQRVTATRYLRHCSPLEVTESDVHKVYMLEKDAAKGIFPEGFPGCRIHDPARDEKGNLLFPQDLLKQTRLPHQLLHADRHVIVRQTVLDVIQDLSGVAEKQTRSPGYLLTGISGCGKSFALAHVVHHFREKGWLVVNIPRAEEWCYKSAQWVRVKQQRGFYDIPDLSQAFLRDMQACNKDKLAALPLRTNEGKAIMATLPGNKADTELTLSQFIEAGLNDTDLAGEVAVLMRKELDLVTEHQVLVAIDGYSAFFDNTEYHDEHGRLLPEQMRLISTWRTFGQSDPSEVSAKQSGVVVVAALDKTRGSTNKFSVRSFKKAQPNVSVKEIPAFGLHEDEEMKSLFAILQRQGQLLSTEYDEGFVQYVRAMSMGNAAEAARVCLLAHE